MKKKSTANVKGSSAKTKKSKTVTGTKGRVLEMKNKPAAVPKAPPDPRYTQAVQNYEAGLKAMQEHKFERAKTALQKVLDGPSKELADRARVHLNTCQQHLERSSTSFKSTEEHYDYAVSLMNSGDYDGARAHLEKLLKQNAKADHVHYGLAVLDCLGGNAESALRRLGEAIKLNPSNRFQARNDSDFQNLADDPRFTELLYPETETAAHSR